MMAQNVPHQSTDKRRVKVYELRESDWYDRGTGFCTTLFTPAEGEGSKEARLVVESEDQPERVLLETKICKEDGFQKQQETLIVWTEPSNGMDMALSFQEADGCAMIWRFVSQAQQQLNGNVNGTVDDSISEDLNMDMPPTVPLPAVELENLQLLENTMRAMASSASGRDLLTKSIMSEDYIGKLIPLVAIAEDFESLSNLHYLCNIMKTIILLNDTAIIEHAVSDDCVIGVVGALEYDPDFPQHKANHRQWLKHEGRHKEVVRIEDQQVKRKIHQTYRLQYLKDVVLARILDDATFSVLNSLIFFNQVDIVQHLQSNPGFLRELFSIFLPDHKAHQLRKKEAVMFIQQCCGIAKNLQIPARQTLYNNFLSHGLLMVINYGLLNVDVAVRIGATDILVAMIDHDPQMIRQTIYRQIQDKNQPLIDVLIELLLVEVDLGIKSQVSDALKVLLDPSPPPSLQMQQQQHQEAQRANGDSQIPNRPRPQPTEPQQILLLDYFYEHSATKLFRPLLELQGKTELKFVPERDGIFSYLNEIMCFYIRSHQNRCKTFVMKNDIAQRFMQLLTCQQKHLQLVAIRFFRHLAALNDEFYVQHLADKQVLGPALDVLLRILPRDNLLSSACLELFDFIQKEKIKELTKHLLESYPEKIGALSYMPTFRKLQRLYSEMRGYAANVDSFFIDSEDDSTRMSNNPKMRMMEHITMDPAEEEYWNNSDDEADAEDVVGGDAAMRELLEKGLPTPTQPLVDYASDEELEDAADIDMTPPPLTVDAERSRSTSPPEQDDVRSNGTTNGPRRTRINSDGGTSGSGAGGGAGVGGGQPPPPPPERLSEKRRREEDEEEDAIGKLSQTHKRRNSSAERLLSSSTPAAAAAAATASSSPTPTTAAASTTAQGPALRKKKSVLSSQQNGATTNGGGGGGGIGLPKRISISLSGPKLVDLDGKGSKENDG